MSLPIVPLMPTQPLLEGVIVRPISQGWNSDPRSERPMSLTAIINWKRYGAGANIPTAISINTAPKGVSGLGSIRGVWVDNSYSQTPVCLYFPDTQFSVFCPANSQIMAPVWTNQADQAIIYGDLFTSLEDPVTTVIFSNYCNAGYQISPSAGASGGGGTSPVTGLTIGRTILLAGGGGGGFGLASFGYGGGGGGGGFIDSAIPYVLPTGPYPVVVGAGGNPGQNGGNTSFGALTAQGGGRGGQTSGSQPNGETGGSGGGGGGGHDSSIPPGSGGAGIPLQGSNGGSGGGGGGLPFGPGGGGGGANGVGATGVSAGNGAAGGAGVTTPYSGSDILGAGGGGAGLNNGGSGGNPGYGTGANDFSDTPGLNGQVNCGGGGGGGIGNYVLGGSGSNGRVIIEYSGPPAATGGTIYTSVPGKTLHVYTISGTFTVL